VAFVLADRVKETTTTAGLVAAALAGAALGSQTFLSGIGDGNSCFYCIAGQGTSEWEVGIGTYTSATNSLSRDSVISSSNANAPVNFSAGAKDVYVTNPSSRNVIGGKGMVEHTNVIDRDVSITSGNNAISSGPVTVATGKTVTVPTGSVWSIV